VEDIFGAGSTSGRLDHQDPPKQKSKASGLLQSPIKTVRSAFQGQLAKKITDNMAATEISHHHNVELIESHDSVLQAKTSREKLVATDRRNELLKARETELVRWTLDRHVTRVRALSEDPVFCQPRSSFQTTDRQGQLRTEWASYATHVSVIREICEIL
jgi:hypothetical protein